MTVDLPAPFSPISACTDPDSTFIDTSLFAMTPGNLLLICRSSTAIATTKDSFSHITCPKEKRPVLQVNLTPLLDRAPLLLLSFYSAIENYFPGVVGTLIFPEIIPFAAASIFALYLLM